MTQRHEVTCLMEGCHKPSNAKYVSMRSAIKWHAVEQGMPGHYSVKVSVTSSRMYCQAGDGLWKE